VLEAPYPINKFLCIEVTTNRRWGGGAYPVYPKRTLKGKLASMPLPLTPPSTNWSVNNHFRKEIVLQVLKLKSDDGETN